MTDSFTVRSPLRSIMLGPMTLLRMAAVLSAVAAVTIGPLLIFAHQAVLSQKEFDSLATSSFPNVISFLEGVPKDQPCPDRPTFENGCLLFNGFVAYQDGNKVDVTFRWTNGKGGPIVTEPVMTVLDGRFEFAPNVDQDRMRVRIFAALREVVSKTSPLANLIHPNKR